MAFAQAKDLQPDLISLQITPEPDESAISKLLNWIVDVGINGFGFLPSAQDVAEQHLSKSKTREDAINSVINRRCVQAVGTGFVTGLGGMAVLPLALPASLASSYALAANSIAAIAYLRGYDIDSGQVRSMVLLCLLGRSAERVLKTAGVQVTKRLTQQAVKAIPSKVLVEVNRRIGFRLVAKAGEKSMVNVVKLLPIAGGIVGAGVDGHFVRKAGLTAKAMLT